MFCDLPYRGKINRGKVAKFWLGDESFLGQVFSLNEYFYPDTNIIK